MEVSLLITSEASSGSTFHQQDGGRAGNGAQEYHSSHYPLCSLMADNYYPNCGFIVVELNIKQKEPALW